MDVDALKEGKEAYYAIVVEPLTAAGMVRKAGLKLADLDKMHEELAAKLAYLNQVSIPATSYREKMTGLHALAEMIRRNGGGDSGDKWPPQLHIEKWAHQICPAPASDSAMVRRWFAVYGKIAIDQDFAIEALVWLKENGTFPTTGTHAWNAILQKADGRREREKHARAQIAKGLANDGHIALATWCDRGRARAQSLVDDAAEQAA